jgi:hypothetical protein
LALAFPCLLLRFCVKIRNVTILAFFVLRAGASSHVSMPKERSQSLNFEEKKTLWERQVLAVNAGLCHSLPS